MLMLRHLYLFFFFFFNDTATTEIYTLSLHDALPIFLYILIAFASAQSQSLTSSTIDDLVERSMKAFNVPGIAVAIVKDGKRSEEHTSELQSLTNLVCRLLLEKKKKMSLTVVV